jgi:hypothetical protein
VSVLLGMPCRAVPPWYADMDVCQPLFFQRLAYSTGPNVMVSPAGRKRKAPATGAP